MTSNVEASKPHEMQSSALVSELAKTAWQNALQWKREVPSRTYVDAITKMTMERTMQECPSSWFKEMFFQDVTHVYFGHICRVL